MAKTMRRWQRPNQTKVSKDRQRGQGFLFSVQPDPKEPWIADDQYNKWNPLPPPLPEREVGAVPDQDLPF